MSPWAPTVAAALGINWILRQVSRRQVRRERREHDRIHPHLEIDGRHFVSDDAGETWSSARSRGTGAGFEAIRLVEDPHLADRLQARYQLRLLLPISPGESEDPDVRALLARAGLKRSDLRRDRIQRPDRFTA